MTTPGVRDDPWTEARFLALYERLRPRLSSILSRYQIPPEDGDDLLQQTFLTFLRRRSEVEDPEAWIAGTLRNLSVMYWRRRRRRRDQAVDPPDLENAAAALATSAGRLPQERLELRGDLERYLARLPERQRCLLRMRFALGFATAEVADFLGRHPSNVSRGVHRGLAELVRLMGEDPPAGRAAAGGAHDGGRRRTIGG